MISAAPDLVVAFRTHVWNDDVAGMARRLAAVSGGTRFVIVADETKGALDTAPFEKIAHTTDFSAFGLPSFPAKVLWYNGDYPLYVLRQAFPAATHYAMAEYDVAVNIDLGGLLRHAQQNDIDLIAHRIGKAPADWMWTRTVAPYFAKPMMSFVQLGVFSGRGIDHMLSRRREIFSTAEIKTADDWPFCEALIPSAIAELPGARMDALKRHAQLPQYFIGEATHVNDPEGMAPGTVAHPVLGSSAIIAKCIFRYKPDAVFDPESRLRRLLSFCAPAEFMPALQRRIRAAKDLALDARLTVLSAELGWLPAPANIALGKPATQSSISEWSNGETPEADAAGGNNGYITGDFGFHTEFERDPWWQVDLLAGFAVERVALYNRLEFPERCTRVAIYGSADGETWTMRAAKLDDALFGGADGCPYVFDFATPFPARFIRLGMIGEGYLHLDEIEVYGQRIPV
jgi:hypothetical protein